MFLNVPFDPTPGDTAQPIHTQRPSTAEKHFPTLLEFIAGVVDHIPEPSQQMIRYWGWYAYAARGKRRKKTEEGEQAGPGPGRDDAVDAFTRQARLTWAKLIRRVYELELLDQTA